MQVLAEALFALSLLLQTNSVPLADFTGKVHGVTKTDITIETEQGNLVEFTINRKTTIHRNGKKATPADLKTGDPVTVEAKEEILGYLVAVHIQATAEPSP